MKDRRPTCLFFLSFFSYCYDDWRIQRGGGGGGGGVQLIFFPYTYCILFLVRLNQLHLLFFFKKKKKNFSIHILDFAFNLNPHFSRISHVSAIFL